MTEYLNRPEVEFIGDLLHSRLRGLRASSRTKPELRSDYDFAVKRTNNILRKLDYPEFRE